MAWLPLTARLWSAAWLCARPLFKRRALSPNGLARWGELYEREQDEEAPPASLFEFARLLLAYGPPDVGNPWPQGEEAHYRIHPGGFLAGEIENALVPGDSDASRARSAAALDRLGLLLHWGCPMLSAQAYWAQEDLRFACSLALAEGRWELAGGRAPSAVINALFAGLIEPAVAPGLLIARRLFEEAWHPAPWSSPPAKPAPPDPPPPPPLAQWRAARAQALGQSAARSEDAPDPGAPEAEPMEER